MKNEPYVKQYNELGECINPIKTRYISQFKNRSTRRKTEQPFFGNGKNYPMVLIGVNRFKKVLQLVRNTDGSIKKIYHYFPA